MKVYLLVAETGGWEETWEEALGVFRSKAAAIRAVPAVRDQQWCAHATLLVYERDLGSLEPGELVHRDEYKAPSVETLPGPWPDVWPTMPSLAAHAMLQAEYSEAVGLRLKFGSIGPPDERDRS